jgi:hypothetical protein
MADEKPPYFREWLTSQGNLYALLASVAAAAVLSIPFGFGIGAIPLIAFAAGEVVAGMYIPSSITYRNKVDRRYREAARNGTRAHLVAEISRRMPSEARIDRTFDTHERMAERIASLYRLVADKRTQLSVSDVEKLDDATIDYLCVQLALLIIDDRSAAVDQGDIERRIAAIERELAAKQPGTDERQLLRARSDYLALASRHRRMLSRKAALEAALIAMPDQMEEIYQTIVTAPTSHELGAKLTDAVSNLRLREDIEIELVDDIAEEVPGLVVPLHRTPAQTRAAAAGLQRQA